MTLSDLQKSRTTIKHHLAELHKQPVIPYDVLYVYVAALGYISNQIRELETRGFIMGDVA